MKWSATHNPIGGNSVWARPRADSGGLCSGRQSRGAEVSVNINQMRTNASGDQSAKHVTQKLTEAFYSWLGRMGELIVPALVPFGALPKLGCSLAAAVPGRVFFFFFLNFLVFKNRDLEQPPSLGDLLNACLLGPSINWRPSCLPVSPRPLPLGPCGFCHLFTGEWPLHRRDLNVSLLPLSLCFSPSPPYTASTPPRVCVSKTLPASPFG